MTRQSIKLFSLTPARLSRVFEGLVISPAMLEQLGPASVSGKPLFLYGPPGNGKTTIAMRLGQVWDDAVILPYALYVEGHVIRVYDDISHRQTLEDRAADVGDSAAGCAAAGPWSWWAAN